MRKLRTILILSILSALLLGGLWLLVPAPEGAEAAAFYSPLGTPLTLVDLTLAICGALLFLRALKNFKPQLKPAYRFIAWAQLSLGLLTLMYPYVEYYNLWGTVLIDMATYLPYLASSILSYLGIRQFSKILNLRTKATSLRLLAGVIVVGWMIHAFLPHVEIFDSPEYVYDLFEIIPIIPVVLYGCAAYMALRLRQRVGGEYGLAFTWLTIGLVLQWLTTILVFGFDLFGYDNWLFNSRAYYVFPVIVSDFSLLLAAFYFNTVGLPSSKILRRHSHTGAPATSIDIILYATSLTSDVTKVDPYLDKMRYITASMQPGQPLSPQDQQALRAVYIQIEEYLIHSDPMRSFDRRTLRQTIATQLNLDPGSSATFWPLL